MSFLTPSFLTPSFVQSFIVAFCAAAALSASARASIEIDITEGNLEPLPIAIAPFQSSSEKGRKMGSEIHAIITANLKRSGLFKIINPRLFPPSARNRIGALNRPSFHDWRAAQADALVTGKIQETRRGVWSLSFRLWDIYAEKQMTGRRYRASQRSKRQVAHLLSDAIYERITGEDGYFNTQIVFVQEKGPKNNRQKRLAVMDQDSANHRFITKGDVLVLTPRFSPSSQEITYVSYFKNTARVYLHHLESDLHEIVGNIKGMTFAPRFSPDGKHLIMSLARRGRTNIYKMNLQNRTIKALTKTNAIDTAPSYAPDGKNITFESDRGGSQQIYVMDENGKNPKRISFGKGNYGTPVWSPRGDQIAFTKSRRGQFYIGVMRTDGKGERILAKGFHNEGPTWSPNGRVLIFFRETPGSRGGPSIWSVDLTGANKRKIPTPSFASDPAWSPLLEAKNIP